MTCLVDPVAWGEKNRVVLTTGKTHQWVLARTTRDRPTLGSLPQTARAVMVKWFDGVALDTQFADAGTAVDDITVTAVSETMPTPAPADQRRESLDPIPLLVASATPPLFVSLRFNYRGYQKSLPWPVWTATASPFKLDKLCPFDADWMLAWSKAPAALETAPEEHSGLDKLSEHGPSVLAGLADLTKLAGWGVGIYLGVQVLQIMQSLPAVRRRSA